MRPNTLLPLLGLGLYLAQVAHAQVPPVPPSTPPTAPKSLPPNIPPSTPPAPARASAPVDAPAAALIDPVLVAPVASLKPEQVQGMQQKLSDWAQLGRYREENDRLPPAPAGRVVFYGDSITDAWGRRDNSVFFPGKPYVNRGISGQTTPQMLVRFQQDVVALKPAAVLILAGTNDIAGNTGLSTLPMIEDNFRSMITIAKANNIRVIVASVLPVSEYRSRKGIPVAQKVRDLNAWLRQYAAAQGCTYLDYYPALDNGEGGMKPEYSGDGLHPNRQGYVVMAPLAQAAIDRVMKQ